MSFNREIEMAEGIDDPRYWPMERREKFRMLCTRSGTAVLRQGTPYRDVVIEMIAGVTYDEPDFIIARAGGDAEFERFKVPDPAAA